MRLLWLAPLLLLLTIPPVIAQHGSYGETVDFRFTPSKIAVGEQSYLLITTSAPRESAIYTFFYVEFPGWLDYRVGNILLGDFISGGIVSVCYFKTFCGGLQMAFVTPAGETLTIQVPVDAGADGVFKLNNVFLFQGTVANGTITSVFHVDFEKYDAKLVAFDPSLVLIEERLLKLEKQNVDFSLLIVSEFAKTTSNLGLIAGDILQIRTALLAIGDGVVNLLAASQTIIEDHNTIGLLLVSIFLILVAIAAFTVYRFFRK